METGTIIAMVAAVVTGATGVGVSLRTVINARKRILLKEIATLRDELFELSRTNERARVDLEESYLIKFTSEKSIADEVNRLQKAVTSIVEYQRKSALDELSILREQLHELAISSDRARIELQNSHTRKVSTQQSAEKESIRLRRVIGELRGEQRKKLLDELSVLRSQLLSLSRYNEDSKSKLEESYDVKLSDNEDISGEIIRLRKVIRETEDQNRKDLLDQLEGVRNKLHSITTENDVMRKELESSYKKRLVSDNAIREEIDRLDLTIVKALEINRGKILSELNNIRDELYIKSRTNEWAKISLDESYNKNILGDIAEKEIERLETAKERIIREEKLEEQKSKFKLFL